MLPIPHRCFFLLVVMLVIFTGRGRSVGEEKKTETGEVTFVPAVASGQETEAAKTPKATAKQLATWIQDLSAEQFVGRETATLKLIEVGSTAIDPLVQALPRSNPEATARIIHILRQLALNEEWT
ncbi:MAG TPA: hypothetical protein EYN70_01535, partial [Planctomycetaceae bacterium]|nr:hypothetical protein [Planctomycetaceae bacterium]